VVKTCRNDCYLPSASDVSTYFDVSLSVSDPNTASWDLALFLGAGNLNQVIPEVIASIRERNEGKIGR